MCTRRSAQGYVCDVEKFGEFVYVECSAFLREYILVEVIMSSFLLCGFTDAFTCLHVLSVMLAGSPVVSSSGLEFGVYACAHRLLECCRRARSRV